MTMSKRKPTSAMRIAHDALPSCDLTDIAFCAWVRTAAEDLELDRDPGQQRQDHAGGDQMNGRLNRCAPHEADAVEQ